MESESFSTINSRAPLTHGDESSGRNNPFPRTPSPRDQPELVDTRDQGAHIKHGILPDYSLRAKGHVHSVLFDPKSQCATVHHGKGVSVYHRRKLEQEIQLEEKASGVMKLLHAKKYDLYVGVCKSCLKLLKASFECFYERESESRIVSAVYNSWSGEIITSGPGNITVSQILMGKLCGRVKVYVQHVYRYGYFVRVLRSLLLRK